MAGELQQRGKARSKKELIASLEQSRAEIAGGAHSIGNSLNARQRFEESVRSRPLLWGAGALAGGLIVARLLIPSRRTRERKRGRKAEGKKKAGFSIASGLGIVFKTAFKLTKPLLEKAAKERLAALAAGGVQDPKNSRNPKAE